MRDIHETLELWGAWAASENSGLDFSPVAAGFKGLLPDTSRSRIQCSEDEGIIVDGCVARLKKYRLEEYELVILHYVFNVSLRKIAKKRNCSDGTVRKNMQTALGFIDGVMYMLGS